MKTKKAALIFNWTLTFIVIGVLAFTLVKFNSKYNKFEPLGKKQLNVFKTYQKAESTLFYIDQSAKYALQQAVYELAKDGGVAKIAGDEISSPEEYMQPNGKCGNYYGYNIWHTENNYCFDETKVNINLEYLFNKNLNQYMLNHPHNIPLDNYGYEIKDSLEIIGKAITPLKFHILKDETKPVIKKPTEIKSYETQEDFMDFMGTELCSKGAKCILKKEAYNLLLKSQEVAKQKGVSLEVTSGYRTIGEQNILWKRNPDSKYVCPPSPTCPHLTGNAVDVKLKEKTDWFLLHKIMSQAGWIGYTKEPWHFECCGTIRYAKAKDLEEKTGKPVTEIA